MPIYLFRKGISTAIKADNTDIFSVSSKSIQLHAGRKSVFVSIFVACFFLLSTVSCKLNTPEGNPINEGEVIAPDKFDYKTTRQIDINLQLLASDNKPITKIPIGVHLNNNGQRGESLLEVISDGNGFIKATVTVPSYVDTLIVDVPYIGILQYAKAVISGSQITGVLGGAKGFSGSIAANEVRDKNETGNVSQPSSATYVYMDEYDGITGKPNNLIEPGDVISSTLLSSVNASLPEGIKVSDKHPEYLNSSSPTVLKVEKQSDVWITFVGEDAGFLNTLGYYTYATGSDPASISDIKKVTYILPNASFNGSGGALYSGNKVNLGKFDAGTSIGFVLFQNGWTGSAGKKVNPEVQKWYSNDILNDETGAANKRHSVLIYDNVDKLFLIGFEDLRRGDKNSDEDFNDLVFYATSSTADGISTGKVNITAKPNDKDGDGILDDFDQFPADATKAFVQYFPSENVWATLAFEDQWPNVGDYDLNDLVVGYRYKLINNAANETVEMTGSYVIRAVGATFNNGFGVELPFAPDLLSSITGQRISGSYVQLSNIGYEAGQSKAVIIPFDKTSVVIKSGYVNTTSSATYITGDTVNVQMIFKSPISSSLLGAAPFNPFMMINQKRGYEVHLPNQKPTDKADKTLFGTLADNSNTATGTYYLSKLNWPFALSFYEPFDYPTEVQTINKGFLHFFDWTRSGGKLYTDWYKNQGTGYRNSEFIYKKK